MGVTLRWEVTLADGSRSASTQAEIAGRTPTAVENRRRASLAPRE